MIAERLPRHTSLIRCALVQGQLCAIDVGEASVLHEDLLMDGLQACLSLHNHGSQVLLSVVKRWRDCNAVLELLLLLIVSSREQVQY